MNKRAISDLSRMALNGRLWWKDGRRAASRLFSAAPSEDTKEWTLYQYKICPFCNYAKAVLHFGRIPFDAVEVNPLTKAELKWSQDYKKVPILLRHEKGIDPSISTTNKQFNGSDDIVAALLDIHRPQFQQQISSTSSMDEFCNSEKSRFWTGFAKQDLAPLLYPNLCATLSDSYRAFDYIHKIDNFTRFQKLSIQMVGSVAMYMAASKVMKRRKITDAEAALKEALVQLDEGLDEKKSSFLSTLGDPSLGDLAVFGVLRGLEGVPVHEKVLSQQPRIAEWYARMTERVGSGQISQ